VEPSAAAADSFRFGLFEADLATGELRKRGRKVALQEQPFQVLALLLRHAGEVVAREELQRALWPADTFVEFEQGLNTAIKRLRLALGDAADSPRFVETLPRKGYRFIAPVSVPEPPASEAPAAVAAQESVPSHARLWWCVGGLIAAVLVTGLWPVPAPRTRVTQLTHGGNLIMPWLAVHGGRILYTATADAPDQTAGRSWTEFLSISTEGGEPRRERMPFLLPKYVAQLLQADSRQGAILVVTYVAGETRGEMWLAGFDGSKPRQIGEYLPGNTYSVSPDLRTLLRSSKEGLFARPVDGGPERLVARIDWRTPSLTFWHPSGERIGFLPLKDGPTKLWEVKSDGTGMRPLLPEFPGEQYSAFWSPDGERLYFVSRGEIYVRGSRRWLGWMRRPEPQRLTVGSAGYHIPTEDPTDPRVIYSNGEVVRGELMKLNRRTDHFEPYLDRLSAECLDYSPDGEWIAYVSYPGRELWKCRRDGSDKVLLEDGLLTYMPRWSPDGKRLAFAAHRKGVSGELPRIYTIDPNGGKSELVKGVNGPGFTPEWSPDGTKLVFASLNLENVPKQGQHVSIVDLETGQVQVVPGSEGLISPRWSPDGKHLVALTLDGRQPVIYDFETGRWTIVDAKVFGFPKWSKDSRYVYGIMGNPPMLARIEITTRKVEEDPHHQRVPFDRKPRRRCLLDSGWGGLVLADHSTSEIYRIEVER